MKFEEAMSLINQKSKIKRAASGYRIRFEVVEDGQRVFDYFPETFEKGIKSIKRAKRLAEKFTNKTDYQNICVTNNLHQPIS